MVASTFAVSAAAVVVLASLSKALFLSANPISTLPWMFLGSAGITAISSLIYVALMKRFSLEARFPALLGIVVATLVALRLAFPLQPKLVSVLILLWCPTAGHLVVVQSWNMASSLLPTRQGKRLFPVLAAITTLGAAMGGGFVQVLLNWIGAEDLLLLGALLLGWPFLRIRGVIRHLVDSVSRGGTDPDEQDPSVAEEESDVSERAPKSEVVSGLRSITKKPLLGEIAVFVFLLQAASLLIDYQFSAELKPKFSKDELAAFLGTFYWSSNLVVLVLTLLVTSRFVRLVGIGLALSASAIVLGLGSALYVGASLTSIVPAFWVIAATAFAERIAQYSFTKPAQQMAFMPLQTRGGERAKTLIDGVVYRLATATVSVLLLVAAPDLASQFRLSPPAVIACAVVVYLGVRIGPHYRRALLEALRARRLAPSVARYLQNGLDSGAISEVQQRLLSGEPRKLLAALDIASELALPIPDAQLAELAEHDDEGVARAALRLMGVLGREPDGATLKRILNPSRPPRVLRALLQLLGAHATHEIAEAVRPLTKHRDPSVASAACVLRIRAVGGSFELTLDDEITAGEQPDTNTKNKQPRITGMTRAGDFARELPELLDNPESKVRRDAIEQMGQLALPFFVPPLIACLVKSDARKETIAALARYGERVLPAISKHLGDPQLSLAARIALLQALERIGSPASVEVLVEQCSSSEPLLQHHAVKSLWRVALDEEAPRPSKEVLKSLVLAQIDLLRTLAAVEVAAVGKLSQRRAFFIAELQLAQQLAEARAFRLLGILYERDALQRAFIHYGSPVQRVRSNALELLDQHIADQKLRAFVPLVERSEDVEGNLRPKSIVYQALEDRGSVENLLSNEHGWLKRVWGWALARDEVARTSLDYDDPLDRVVLLKRFGVFREMSGQQLLGLGAKLERLSPAEGEHIVEKGGQENSIYWVLKGKVEVVIADEVIARVGHYECFGEMAAIDEAPRWATVRAATDDTIVLRLPSEALQDAIDLNPALLRGIIEVLTRRLRETIARS